MINFQVRSFNLATSLNIYKNQNRKNKLLNSKVINNRCNNKITPVNSKIYHNNKIISKYNSYYTKTKTNNTQVISSMNSKIKSFSKINLEIINCKLT